MKHRTLKVFAPPALQKEVGTLGRVIAHYDAFVVVDVDAAAARVLARRFPYEDMAAQYRVRVRGREFDPLAPRRRTPATDAPIDGAPHHYLVQFVGPVKPQWLSAVVRAGGVPRRSMGGFCYVVQADGRAWKRIQRLPFVRWSRHLPYSDRMASVLRQQEVVPLSLPGASTTRRPLTLELFDPADLDDVAQAAQREGARVLSRNRDIGMLVLELPPGTTRARLLAALARLHGVARIAPRGLPRTCNDVAARIVGQSAVTARRGGRGLSGEGEIVAVCDTGLDSGDLSTLHADFDGRVVVLKSYPVSASAVAWEVTNSGHDDGPADLDSGHGTHVAGSVLGSGRPLRNGARGAVRGMAPKARLVFQAVEQLSVTPRQSGYAMTGLPDDVTEIFRFAYRHGARIHNNSWESEGPGSYDAACRQLDRFVWRHKDFVVVVAAGNGGTDSGGRGSRGDGRINPMSVAPPGTAKNCLTVGASESLRPRFRNQTYGRRWGNDYPRPPIRDDRLADDPDSVAAFSARGPTKDGRIKPDVVAPGTLILSTRSAWATAPDPDEPRHAADPRHYAYMTGTSMATPIASGCVALLREALRTRHGFAAPSAALLKAWLIAGCVRLPSDVDAWADHAQGWGRINVERSLRRPVLLHEGPALRTGARSRCRFEVPRRGGTLRLAMAYTDFPGHRLVNNLNLIVIDPAGTLHLGNGSGPVGRRLELDSCNNVEALQVDAARPGRWTVDVVASNVPQGPQDFALAAVLV
jgi:serine protease AprX